MTTHKTRTSTVSDVDIQIKERYAEGHVLAANEAEALNGLLVENIGNNLRVTFNKMIAEALEKKKTLTPEDFQEVVDRYQDTYTFGARRTRTKTPADPVEALGLVIAKDVILKALEKEGKTFTKEQIVAASRRLYDKNPKIRTEAERQINISSQIGVAALAELGIED